MNNAQPWNDSKFSDETDRYFEHSDHQEFEAGKQYYTNAWNVRDIDPANARALFQQAANHFGRCDMPGLQKQAIDEMNSLGT